MKNQITDSLYNSRDMSVSDKLMKENCICDNDNKFKVSVNTYLTIFLKLLLIIVIFAIVTSIPVEYMRLYEKARSQKISQVAQGKPSKCNPENMTFFESIKELLNYYFSWTHAHNPCEDYYNALLVDPVWEVTPIMVLSSVISRGILHPLELISDSLGKILLLFFSEIPVQWQLVLMIVAVIILVLLLLMLFNYRLSVPWLLRIEPNPQRHQILSRSFSCPNTDSNGSADRLPVSGAGSRKKCLLSSLSTTSFDRFNNHNSSGETTLSFTSTRKFIIPECSNRNLDFSATVTSSNHSSQMQNLLRHNQRQKVPDETNISVEENKVVRIRQIKETVTVENLVPEQKYEKINGQMKRFTQNEQKKRNVAKKKTKEIDPLWTPNDDR